MMLDARTPPIMCLQQTRPNSVASRIEMLENVGCPRARISSLVAAMCNATLDMSKSLLIITIFNDTTVTCFLGATREQRVACAGAYLGAVLSPSELADE